ncbi:MAG: NADH pyrophosphatase, partial [Hyphomicrobiales bacterium]|nr:NADH pyrophosphatase [Hyphomicrobiales bacterium]
MTSLFHGLPKDDPSQAHGFSGSPIDRRSENRSEESLAEALDHPAARLYLLRHDLAVVRKDSKDGNGGDPLFTRAEIEVFGKADTLILLGWTAAGPRLAATLPEEAAVDEDALNLVDLRTMAIEGTVETEHLGAFAQARSLSHWNIRHRYCGVCGGQTAMRAGGYRRQCLTCGAPNFPRTDPVVIMLAVDASGPAERCLLGRQTRFVEGMYSCLAGFVEPGETIEDA